MSDDSDIGSLSPKQLKAMKELLANFDKLSNEQLARLQKFREDRQALAKKQLEREQEREQLEQELDSELQAMRAEQLRAERELTQLRKEREQTKQKSASDELAELKAQIAEEEKDKPYLEEISRLKKERERLKQKSVSDELAELKAEIAAEEKELRKQNKEKPYREEIAKLRKQQEKLETKTAREELEELRAEIARKKQEEDANEESRDDREWEERQSDQKGKPKSGFSRVLSVGQAFNFHRDRHVPFGYVTMLGVGSRMLAPGYMMQSPLKTMPSVPSPRNARQSAATLPVVGALAEISWELGAEDPIRFSCRIGASAKNTVMGVQYATTASVDVEVSWVVYEYDEVAKSYYISFSSSTSGNDSGGAVVRGQIVKSSQTRALELTVGFSPADEVEQPQNFELEFEMRPKTGMPQQLYIGTSLLGRLNKMWGVAAAK